MNGGAGRASPFDPDQAADRIAHAIDGVIQAAQLGTRDTPTRTLG